MRFDVLDQLSAAQVVTAAAISSSVKSTPVDLTTGASFFKLGL